MNFLRPAILPALMCLLYHHSSSAQYCTNVGPSSTADSNVESAQLTGDGATSINFTGCPGVTGLDDQTATQSVNLSANSSYTLNVQFGTCGGNWSGSGEAWIDFNGNQLFETGESIGTWQGTPPTALSSFTFTVPSNCVNGSVRMRIIQQENSTPPLNPCGTFTWGCAIDFTVVLSGGSGAPGYCTSVGPSSTADSNLQLLDIQGEGGSQINFTGCPGVVGLDDQTAIHSVNLAKGSSYTLQAYFGTCGGNYGGAGEVWIDFNQNGTFEPSESIGSCQGAPPGAQNFNFTVPLTAIDGTTRMRVVHQESVTPPLNPCATFTWGSTTDFGIEIGGQIDCSGYVGDDMSDPRIVSSLPFQEDYNNSVCYTNNVPVYNSSDVFYLITPQLYGVDYINVSLCGSTIDTYLQVLDTGGNVLHYNDDYGPCAPQSELSLFVGDQDTVFVVVQGWNNQEGDYSISINDGEVVGLTSLENDISIYPNPTNGIVHINGLGQDTNVSVIGINGQIVSKHQVNNSAEIDLSDMQPGVYLIEITAAGQKTIRKKIILTP
ncbi:MAG: T9SS type A sorting domain-containing protein [Crocinitomicaceae bacterium]|nr:T9SS type A sorting domain-containing protein [Crocinitomicaceae bacterium]